MEKELIVEKKGLSIQRYFIREGLSPFAMFTYERRSSLIKNPDGSIVFQMEDVEVPLFWSQVATDILAQKYFRKAGVPLRNEKGELLLDEKGKVITGCETSIQQLAHRLAGCWRFWGEKYGYFASTLDAQNYYDEMVYMIIAQIGAPNSPQWFTTGLNWAYGLTGPGQGHSYINPLTKKLEYSYDAYTRSQTHACFIQSIEDDLVREKGIFSLLTREARIFKYGSGTGSNFSQIRGKGEYLSGGGSSSGLMSFLKIFDVAAGSIKSGGTTRRAAKMVCLDLDHPEIRNFIWWKVKEEEKVASLVTGSKIAKLKLSCLVEAAKNKPNPLADSEVQLALQDAARNNLPLNFIVRTLDLAKQGYTPTLEEFDTHYESEAYLTVSGQNSNNSIRIPNSFFTALENNQDWELKGRIYGEVLDTIPAQKLWEEIGYCAWASADPGVQYDTTINEWNTCLNSERIRSSNPCGEFNFLDDTACNLVSLNLRKFYDEEEGKFILPAYRHAIRLWTITLEISILMAHFPSETIALKSFQYRPIGLGFANLGSLLMLQGIPYDSEKGRAIASALTAIMTGDTYATSAELAEILGPFEYYHPNKVQMLKVIRNHRRAAYATQDFEDLTITPQPLLSEFCPLDLLKAAQESWDQALIKGELFGYRNAQATVIAPTGTIGLVMDCDTTGIEPEYALVKMKKLAGGGYFKMVNSSVPKALLKLGYSNQEIKEIVTYCIGSGSLKNSPGVNWDNLKERGLSEEQLILLEKELPHAMTLQSAFNLFTVGKEHYSQITEKNPDFLTALGYTSSEITMANDFICGRMTLEEAPHLKKEHYPVFDCASRCGKYGHRFIYPYGHLKMLAAVQSFISGAISKTINLPNETTIKEIKQIYLDAWKMMIKATALYRDGCKLSQPLNTTLEESSELKKILENLPSETKREENKNVEVRKNIFLGPKKIFLKGFLKKEKLISVSLQAEQLSPLQQTMIAALVNSVNLSLENGLQPRVIAAKSLNVDGHPVIRELALFLQEFGEEQKEKELSHYDSSYSLVSDFADKKKCSGCGATQLRQNGTCLLCEICGETSGCS